MKGLIKDKEVLNDLLGYKGLKIIQKPGQFNFSLDSTLLAHFVTLKKDSKKILDLCTGNAPIPLMLTLRTNAQIVGVEIQADSFDQGRRSVAINELEEQIQIYHDDLKLFHHKYGSASFDVVTCNPPYFKVTTNAHLNENESLTIARHEVRVTLNDVVRQSAFFLKPGGRFAMVHRPDRLIEIIETFKVWAIEPKRIRFCHPRRDKEANSMLIEGVLEGKPGGLRLETPLVVYEGHSENYTAEILKIFNLKRKI